MVIFAHSIVPHNHHEADAAGCYNIVHSHSSEENQSGKILRFVKLPCGENVCHLNGFEYFQLNTDNLFLINDKASQAHICEVHDRTSFHGSPEFVSVPHPGKPGLRAPPLS